MASGKPRTAPTPSYDSPRALHAWRRMAVAMLVDGETPAKIQETLKETGASAKEARRARLHAENVILPRLVQTQSFHSLRRQAAKQIARAEAHYTRCVNDGEHAAAATTLKHISDLRALTPGRCAAAQRPKVTDVQTQGIDARHVARDTALMAMAHLQAAIVAGEVTPEVTRQIEQVTRALVVAEEGEGIRVNLTVDQMRERIAELAPAVDKTPLGLLSRTGS